MYVYELMEGTLDDFDDDIIDGLPCKCLSLFFVPGGKLLHFLSSSFITPLYVFLHQEELQIMKPNQH